ncbi:MAG: DUF2207 domain-containing protein [Lachnospiraceae bacterium]|nr:DUF2207 domain-containing protein [Lachnospiraceae bacterium]
MYDKDFNKRLSSMRFSRVFAWIGLIVILVIVVATFITGITGSKYFLPCLILAIIIPVLMYVMLWIAKLMFRISEDNHKNESKEADKEKD